MRILSHNLLRDSVVTASSSNDLFPVANLYSKRKAQEFRFTGYTSENIVIYKDGLEFNAIVIDNHNITSTATVKFQANASDVWTSPSVDVTATVGDVISYFWSSTQDYDYFRILIEDTDNTEPVKIGMCFLSLSDSFDIRPGWGVNKVFSDRATYRTMEGSFPYLVTVDKTALESVISNIAGTISLSATRQQFGSAWPFYVVIEDDVAAFPPLYAVCPDGFNLMRKRTATDSWEGPFNFQEVF